MTPYRRYIAALAAVLLMALGWHYRYYLLPAPFDADAIAASETRMWKAYYQHDIQELGRELVTTMQELFGLSKIDAVNVGIDFAAAAGAFQNAGGDYEQRCIPKLTSAYERIRKATGGEWNSAEVAAAELEWWVKRRTPGQDSPEEVGRSISRLYTLLYGSSNAEMEEAALIRAQAASVRDQKADWEDVDRLLHESYRLLVRGIMKG